MDTHADVRNFNREKFEYELLDSNCDAYDLLVDKLTEDVIEEVDQQH
jgi:hypothetical protein